MLLSFSFQNHRSFAGPQQLNLTPVYPSAGSAPPHSESVPVAGIFGANASGKSNALGALSFLKRLVLSSDKDREPDGGLRHHPFRLGPEDADPSSTYLVDLLLDGVRYSYGVRLDSRQILEEWLYSYPRKHRRKIFERRGDEYSYGEEAQQTSIAQVERVTADNVLFLTTTTRFDQRLVEPVYRWFAAGLSTAARPALGVYREVLQNQIVRQLLRSEARRDLMVQLLRAADTGIHDLVVETRVPEPLDEDEQDPEGLSFVRGRMEPQHRLLFAHESTDGHALFDAREESDGTVQLLQIADRAFSAISRGGTLLVDEIDASLHPMLTAKLIGLFRSPEINSRNAQLIFTSHDTALLGSLDGDEVLGRDQIWFVEKDRETGASNLFPLSDFRPRKEESRVRRYLNGAYGAVPEGSWEDFERVLHREAADVGEALF